MQILECKQKTKRIRVKGLGVVIVNDDGGHADLSKWKS